MAYVIPDSAVFLLKNVPLDVEHKHTWFFDNYQTQYNHFYENYFTDTTLKIQDSQYIRYEDGAIKVPFPISKCIDCNYMMFGNTSFEQRWFYAFITNVEYVSNDVTKIYYEIDELQTWMCFFTLEQCFIERQHQITDTAGDNLLPEGLELGEYVIDWMGMPQELADHYIVVASTLDQLGQTKTGALYNRVYSGAGYTTFEMTAQGVAELNTFLSMIQDAGNTDAIVSIFMCPKFLFTYPNTVVAYISKPTTLNGYTPRNKKLLTYPYTFAYVNNMQGVAANFPWEYFSDITPAFRIYGAIGCTPQLITYPLAYKGQSANIDESMMVGGYPQCSYATDSFKAWVAQQVGSIANAALHLASDSGYVDDGKDHSIFSGNFDPIKNFQDMWNRPNPWLNYHGGSLKDTFKEIGTKIFGDAAPLDSLKQAVQRYIKPPQGVGCSNASALFAINAVGFIYAVKSITSQYAQIIDQYFDRYGYAIHKNTTPNMHARKGWTYVKTRNCVVNGQLPASAAKFIENCFDSGITFWNPDYTMGDYTQDNSPGGI